VRKAGAQPHIVWLDRVWSQAPHNAFTDLTRFNGRWFLTFREGEKHVSEDGGIRILTSLDAERWESAALLTYPVADLRDPKLTVSRDGRLMLTAAGAMHPPSDVRHKTFVWFSDSGRDWTPAEVIGEHDFWLWRVTWHNGKAYSMAYQTAGGQTLRSYLSPDGKDFQVWNPMPYRGERPTEASLLFLPSGKALCLLRTDGSVPNAQLGYSNPPYRGWEWKDLGVRIGGPQLIRIPDGRIAAVVRLHDGRRRTSLCWLDPETPSLTEILSLPSSGDSSYAGLVFHDGLLHISYYSSHEGRTSIYLAKVQLPKP
jgi:hypothetical protein